MPISDSQVCGWSLNQEDIPFPITPYRSSVSLDWQNPVAGVSQGLRPSLSTGEDHSHYTPGPIGTTPDENPHLEDHDILRLLSGDFSDPSSSNHYHNEAPEQKEVQLEPNVSRSTCIDNHDWLYLRQEEVD